MLAWAGSMGAVRRAGPCRRGGAAAPNQDHHEYFPDPRMAGVLCRFPRAGPSGVRGSF